MACSLGYCFGVTPLPLKNNNNNNRNNKENASWICRPPKHDMSSQQLSLLKPVPQDQRYRYGCRTMEVLATNQPIEMCLFDYASSGTTFPVTKNVFTIQNREFEELFSAEIKTAVVELLLRSSIPTECAWTLQALRLGFQERQKDNPIVVHLCIAQGYLSDNEACERVDEISAVISAAQWSGEKIYVDICQRTSIEVELRTTNSEIGTDLSEYFSELYEYNPPCPGFSVGPEDNNQCAGSLTGFIKHGSDVYGLTCGHVVNSSTKILGSDPYRYKDGETEFVITMPAAGDHNVTKAAISENLQTAILQIKNTEERKASNVISSKHSDRILEIALLREKHWEKAEQNANEYKIRIGNVCVTSGSDKSKQFYCGVLDWGIFNTSFSNIQNKHPEYSTFDRGSGFQLFGQQEKSFVADELGQAFLRNAKTHFSPGPEFKPLQEDSPKAEYIYFKPASRSLEWRACKCNGIKSTMKDDKGMVTDEYCFVGRGLGEPLSTKGDSGAPLLDSDFRPTAMIWGGHEGFAGFKDVTYATPLTVILRDVERRMDWEKGSVSYC